MCVISNQISWVFDTMFNTIRDLTDLHLDVTDLSTLEAYRRDRGAVAGWCEDSVRDNVYTLSSYAGVDDASLTGECEPVSEEVFLQLDSVPEDFTSVQIKLLCEGNV